MTLRHDEMRDLADAPAPGAIAWIAIAAFAVLATLAAIFGPMMLDWVTARPVICAGLGAAECGEAVIVGRL